MGQCTLGSALHHASVIRARFQTGVPLTVPLLICLASPAQAQVVPLAFTPVAPPWNAQRLFEPTPLPDLLDRDAREDYREQIQPEDMPVKTRQQPGYEPIGIRSGSWMYNPSLAAGLLYDSNIFSSNVMKRSDIAAVVEPNLRAHTLWERHGIDLKLDAQTILYNQNPGLNQTNASLKGNAWLDVSPDLMVLTAFQAAHLNEGVGTLSSPVNAVQPTPYDLFSGDVSVRKEFNRLTTSVGMGAASYAYGTTRAQDGSVIDQSSRDGQIYTLHGRVDYAFSPILGWFAGVEGNQRNLRGTVGHPLDSDGYRVLSGVTIGLTHLITAEFGGGYVQQRFVDPTIGTVAGPTYRAMLTWSPTRLLDVHFKAEQIVTETAETGSTGVVANAVQLGLDYELLRNVVVSLAGSFERDRFVGQLRKDNVISTDSNIKYLMNRFASVSVFHRYLKRDSDIPVFSFEKHQVGINVTAQF